LNFIKTTAPISIDNLKKYFVDKDTFFIVDYKNSVLKGSKLLTYLSNLDVPADIDFAGCSDDEFFEMVEEYLNSQTICNIAFLEKAVITILKEKAELSNTEFFEDFILKNSLILDEWLSKIYSLSLFNMYAIDVPEYKKFVTDYPLDTTDSLVGVNFVSLLKHEELYDLYQVAETSKMKYYKTYFDEYIFKGKNLYSYWANENNPMFLLTFSIADGVITGDEYFANIKETIKEIENATPV
jgi:hypothetical protein